MGVKMGDSHRQAGEQAAMRPRVGHIAPGRREGRANGETRAEVWAFLRTYMAGSQGRPPTAREIARGIGVRSTAVVHLALTGLEGEGRIRRGRFGTSRSIQIVGARYVLPDETDDKRGI